MPADGAPLLRRSSQRDLKAVALQRISNDPPSASGSGASMSEPRSRDLLKRAVTQSPRIGPVPRIRALGIRLGRLDGVVGDWPVDAAFNGRTREVIGSNAGVLEVITSEGVGLGLLTASRDSIREVTSRVG